jgi:multiple sugar transport system ATP-binding protein
MAGLEEVTGGTISIGGRVVNDVAPRDRDVAMVFQNYALYPHMSVFENLAFGLKLRKVPPAELRPRVEKAAAALGIERYLERRPRELSGGERQRVALGRAMVREPKVFLFDEPLSNLDARLRVEMRAEIRRLHQRVGATMIYVTHDQVEAMTMGDRIAVLNRGELQQVAAPRTLYARPANTFVAGFIGTPPVNLFEASVSGDGASLDVAGARWNVGAEPRAALAGRSSPAVTVGVRPIS